MAPSDRVSAKAFHCFIAFNKIQGSIHYISAWTQELQSQKFRIMPSSKSQQLSPTSHQYQLRMVPPLSNNLLTSSRLLPRSRVERRSSHASIQSPRRT